MRLYDNEPKSALKRAILQEMREFLLENSGGFVPQIHYGLMEAINDPNLDDDSIRIRTMEYLESNRRQDARGVYSAGIMEVVRCLDKENIDVLHMPQSDLRGIIFSSRPTFSLGRAFNAIRGYSSRFSGYCRRRTVQEEQNQPRMAA